jgi:hypothetical protein
MRTRQLILWTALGACLAAQEGEPGFKWVGLQAGSLSPDTQANLKAAPFFGLQGGLLFEGRRYGLSFQALAASPKSDLAPGRSLSQSEFSASLLTGLSGDGTSRFWPYVGLGLGAASIPRIEAPTGQQKTLKAGTAHASLGFLHRPGLGLVWGVEGRYVFTFANADLKELQAAAMVGFAWGGRAGAARPEPPPAKVEPPAPVVAPAPPPPPPPVVSTVPEPRPPASPAPSPKAAPAQPPVARPMASPTPAPVPAPPAPVPVVVAPPAPAPRPAVLPPAPSRAAGSEVTHRLDALRLGDMAKALELGKKHIASLPGQRWTLRLEIANLSATLKNAVVAFPGQEPDLFIAPIKLKGGRTAYQLFLGDYATRADAERSAKAVPAFFLEGGQRPRPYQINAIPAQ